MRTARFREDELDTNEFAEYAAQHIGETHNLEFQGNRKIGEIAGKYEILDFEKLDNPKFIYYYWKHEEEGTPDGLNVGFYKIRLTDTKYYNGKTFWFPVTAYVQDTYRREEVSKTKALHILNAPRETGKTLKAYEFGIIDYGILV